mmetsp:Transcript_17005/g.59517  ORF Transcript_17005/g.59517 Transcript_17005/m.59517 type:complete len:236 (-) Transcript_17005:60-767(-)
MLKADSASAIPKQEASIKARRPQESKNRAATKMHINFKKPRTTKHPNCSCLFFTPAAAMIFVKKYETALMPQSCGLAAMPIPTANGRRRLRTGHSTARQWAFAAGDRLVEQSIPFNAALYLNQDVVGVLLAPLQVHQHSPCVLHFTPLHQPARRLRRSSRQHEQQQYDRRNDADRQHAAPIITGRQPLQQIAGDEAQQDADVRRDLGASHQAPATLRRGDLGDVGRGDRHAATHA